MDTLNPACHNVRGPHMATYSRENMPCMSRWSTFEKQIQDGMVTCFVYSDLGTGMASERAAMERQMAKLRQSSAAPARHARFGGLFVKRYHREDRGCVMRSNPLVPSLPAIPQLKKTNKTQVMLRPAVYHRLLLFG